MEKVNWVIGWRIASLEVGGQRLKEQGIHQLFVFLPLTYTLSLGVLPFAMCLIPTWFIKELLIS